MTFKIKHPSWKHHVLHHQDQEPSVDGHVVIASDHAIAYIIEHYFLMLTFVDLCIEFECLVTNCLLVFIFLLGFIDLIPHLLFFAIILAPCPVMLSLL